MFRGSTRSAPAPASHDLHVVEPRLDPADQEADGDDREPGHDGRDEDPGLGSAALAPGPQRDPQEQRRGVELRDRDDRDGDARPELYPRGSSRAARRAAARRRPAGTRRRGCRTAPRPRTAARAARRRSRGPPSGAAGGRAPDGQASRDPARTRASRRRPTARARAPFGQPRDQRHRLGDRRRVRVEQLDGVGRRAGEHRRVVRASGRPGRAARPRAAGRGRSLPLAACSARDPADPGDPDPRHDAGDDPRAQASARAACLR